MIVMTEGLQRKMLLLGLINAQIEIMRHPWLCWLGCMRFLGLPRAS